MEQLDLDEGYYDLTRKIKKMFSHAVTHNTRWKFPTLVGGTERTFDYVIKADEDTFINIPVICANFHKMPVNGVGLIFFSRTFYLLEAQVVTGQWQQGEVDGSIIYGPGK